ncbi:MAG: YidC/Oxa1 family insertase periplasmic-domain containing protein, partial [Phycisphaerae bacterium]|nr:YidC/Oxa1 family insertase periplasmic-domain containing protein [Phycisphaerae bacterium]
MTPAIRPAALPSRRSEWSQEIGRPQKITIGSQDQAKGYAFEVELLTQGAAINTLKLSRHFASVQDKRLYAEDPAGYEATRAANPKKYKGRYSLLNPVAFGSSRYLPLATRKVTVAFAGRKEFWPLDGQAWKRLEGPTTGPDGAQWVSFSWMLWRDLNYKDANTPPDHRKFLQIIKTYSVRKGDQSVSVRLEVINHSQFDLAVTLDQYGPTGLSREDLRADARKAAYAYLNPAEQAVNPFFKPRAELAQTQKVNSQVRYRYPAGEQIPLGSSDAPDPLLWLGLSNKFFESFMYLIPAGNDRLDALTYKSTFYLIPAQESAGSRTFLTGMTIPDLQIAPGGSAQFALDLFAGPKKLDMFTEERAKHFKPLYKALGYKNTIELRSCTWAPLTFGMMWLLQKLSIV